MGCKPVLEVGREELLNRVQALRPACTLIVAPTGYGKTWFARKLAGRASSSFVCDLHGVFSLDDLNRALQVESHAADSWEIVVSATYARRGVELIIFENAHAITARQQLVDRVVRIAQLGAVRVVICSRTAPVSLWLRRFAPHDLFRIGMRDLEFRRDEVHRLLASAGASPEMISAATFAANGSPATLIKIAESLAQGSTNPTEFQRLHPPGNMTPEVREPHFRALLSAIARIGFAGAEDLEALGTSASEIAAVTDGNPLFTAEGGGIRVHNRARETFAADSSGDAALESAAKNLASSNPARAAHLYVLAGVERAAVQLIARSLRRYIPQRLPQQMASLIVNAGSKAIRDEPVVWAAIAELREEFEPIVVLLGDARELFRSACVAGSVENALTIAFVLIRYLLDVGEIVEAWEAIDLLERVAEMAGDAADARQAVRLLSTVVRARSGEAVDLSRELLAMAPLLDSEAHLRHTFLLEAGGFAAVAAMDRPTVRSFFDQAGESARPESGARRARGLILSAFFAWAAGEDNLFARQLHELAATITDDACRDARNFVACCSGQIAGHTFFSPLIETCAFVIAASASASVSARKSAVEHALQAAVRCGWDPLIVLAGIAYASICPDRAMAARQAASAAAERLENPEWRKALACLDTAANGSLAAFVDRFRDCGRAGYVLSISARRLTFRKQSIPLTSREFSVLGALAVAGKTIDAKQLSRILFHGGERSENVKALRVSISRLRSKAGDAELIASNKDGYRIGDDVALEVAEAERILRSLANGTKVADDDVSMLESLLAVPQPVSAAAAQEPWAEPWVRRFDLVRHRSMLALAQAAALAGDDRKVIRVTRAALAEDPTDESAVDFLVAALRKRGEIDEAERVLARFSSACLHEAEVK